MDKELRKLASQVYGKLPHMATESEITDIIYKAIKEGIELAKTIK